MRETVLLASVILTGGCQVTGIDKLGSNALPYPEVPTVRPSAVEPATAAPVQGAVWIPARYEWNGKGYDLHPREMSAPPSPSALWQPGHWIRDSDGNYEWLSGRWVEM